MRGEPLDDEPPPWQWHERKEWPYPYDIVLESDLILPGTPNWKVTQPESYHKYKCFVPNVEEYMLNVMEPNSYWVNELNDQRYSLNQRFFAPVNMSVCRVNTQPAYLALQINPVNVIVLIVFNEDLHTPHEILALASQQYEWDLMVQDNSLFYQDEECFKMFIFYKELPLEYMALGTQVEVSFSNPTTFTDAKEWQNKKLEIIKDSLYEQIFLHIWSNFYLDVTQEGPAQTVQDKYFHEIRLLGPVRTNQFYIWCSHISSTS